MANQQHVELIKQGSEAWNRWREQNPGESIDLSEADLRGLALAKANLKGADLKKAKLQFSNLAGASMEGANLEAARLQEANLQGARLVHTISAGETESRSYLVGVWQIFRATFPRVSSRKGKSEPRRENPSRERERAVPAGENASPSKTGRWRSRLVGVSG
ncbi:MAG: pentapeptide repeat-containing protein [Nitrospinae bacterium]|nr:pentapeptide repeat-containing protein [Nitrospinota bacterium]